MTDKTEREDLVEQANELGLEFAPNIGDKKLKQMIDEALGGTVKDEKPKEEPKVKENVHLTPLQKKNMKVAEAKKAAFKTRIVTITNKDAREANVATTAHLSFENNYFGLAKNVPLDVPVELEVALIHIAKETEMTLHKAEVIDGKRTGNSIPVRVKKYSVNYEDTE